MGKDTYYILIAGVGGQGNILASRIVATAAIIEGLHVRIGETYGASQRGGSVVSHVKIGRSVYSPLVPRGYADIVIGLEPLETLRVVLQYANRETLVISNTRPIFSGITSYPSVQDILNKLGAVVNKLYAFDATKEVLERIGTARVLNVFMLGCMHGYGIIPVSSRSFEEAISMNVPGKYVDLNMKAFREGVNKIKSLLR